MGEEKIPLFQEQDDHVKFGTFEVPLAEHGPWMSKRRAIPKRWQVALLGNFGFILAVAARCEFGAIRAMTGNNASTQADLPQILYASPAHLGLIQSLFYVGYAAMHLPAAFSVLIMGLCVGFSCILSFALMLSLTTENAYPAMGVSFVQGGLQGFMYPAMHQMWHYWAPPSERSRLVTTAFVGAYVGMALGMPFAQFSAVFVHWTTPFVINGIIGITWMIIWLYYVKLKPGLDKKISPHEKEHIERAIGSIPKGHHKHLVPWRGILTSLPVWAITLENFARTWTLFLLTQHQLTYMQQGLHLGGLETGILSSIPHIIMAINTAVGGHVADFLIHTNKLNVKNVRKLMNLIENVIMGILLLCLSVGISGFAISGFQVNIFDIAPQHAGILMALSSGFGAISGVICPMVTEWLISTCSNGWQHVFQLAAGIHLFSILFYSLFASGKLQQWAM